MCSAEWPLANAPVAAARRKLHLSSSRFEYLEWKTVKVTQDFSFAFDKVYYSMPQKYLRQKLEIRAGEKGIYVYNKQDDHIRTYKRSYTSKVWEIIPSDMPAEYKDYGYWTVPYFQHNVSALVHNTRALIVAVIQRYAYLVQSVVPKLFRDPLLYREILTSGSGKLL